MQITTLFTPLSTLMCVMTSLTVKYKLIFYLILITGIIKIVCLKHYRIFICLLLLLLCFQHIRLTNLSKERGSYLIQS